MKQKLACAFLLAATAVAIAAETVTIKRSDANLREKADRYATSISKLPVGSSVTVVEKSGDFIKVNAGGKEGWIHKQELEVAKSNISDKKISGITGSGNAGEVEAANAGKGLTEDSIKYARTLNIDPAKVDALRARSKKIIDDGSLAKFEAEGRVGSHKGGK